ncbi:MAG TPA: hypothetical protein VKZ92_03060 [Pseudohongiella sp.]|nr:hypothetical protein [Pseudohongiella sp.]
MAPFWNAVQSASFFRIFPPSKASIFSAILPPPQKSERVIGLFLLRALTNWRQKMSFRKLTAVLLMLGASASYAQHDQHASHGQAGAWQERRKQREVVTGEDQSGRVYPPP